MKQLFEYLISKENKKNISFGKIKDFLRLGDIVQDIQGELYMYLDYETANGMHCTKSGQQIGAFVNSPRRNTTAFINLGQYYDDLRRKGFGPQIMKIWRAPEGYEFSQKDLEISTLHNIIDTPSLKWKLIWER